MNRQKRLKIVSTTLAAAVLFCFQAPVLALASVESRTGEPVVGTSEEYGYSGSQSMASGNSGKARAGGNASAPMNYNQIENLKQEVSDLRGLVEVQDHEIKQLKKSLQDFYLDIDKRLGSQAGRSKSAANTNADAINTNPHSKDIQITTGKGKKSVVITPKAGAAAGATGAAGVGVGAAGVAGAAKAAAAGKRSARMDAMGVGTEPEGNDPASPEMHSDFSETQNAFEQDAALSTDANVTVSMEQPVKVVVAGSAATKGSKSNKKGSSAANAASFDPVLSKPATTSANSAEKGAYESAYSLVRSKRYPDSVVAFKDYLARFPNGERSPNAHYWLGEVYMVQWQADKSKTELLDMASNAFLTITSQFPNHQKVPDSLLKLGIIENERGNLEAARRYLSQTKTNHPGTAAARIAETRLQQLK